MGLCMATTWSAGVTTFGTPQFLSSLKIRSESPEISVAGLVQVCLYPHTPLVNSQYLPRGDGNVHCLTILGSTALDSQHVHMYSTHKCMRYTRAAWIHTSSIFFVDFRSRKHPNPNPRQYSHGTPSTCRTHMYNIRPGDVTLERRYDIVPLVENDTQPIGASNIATLVKFERELWKARFVDMRGTHDDTPTSRISSHPASTSSSPKHTSERSIHQEAKNHHKTPCDMDVKQGCFPRRRMDISTKRCGKRLISSDFVRLQQVKR
jgi:hypothetical protein